MAKLRKSFKTENAHQVFHGALKLAFITNIFISQPTKHFPNFVLELQIGILLPQFRRSPKISWALSVSFLYFLHLER